MEEALDADGDDAAKAKAARYGLKSALDALRGAVAGGGRAGEDVARRKRDEMASGGAPGAETQARKPPPPEKENKRGVDGNEWTRLFGVRDEKAARTREPARDAQPRARRRR